jgi:hypothetical protein
MTPSAPLMPPMALSPRAPGGAPPVVIPLQRELDEWYVGHGVVHDDARHGDQADGQAQRDGQQGAAQSPRRPRIGWASSWPRAI